MRKYHRYTKEQIEYIREIAEGRTVGEIQVEFNKKYSLGVTLKSIKGIMYRNNIKNYMQGYYTRFKKGHNPYNKGKRVYAAGSEKGWFKKGHKDSRLPIGSESNKNGYVTIKIAHPDTWVYKHRYIWEQEYGELKENEAILFKDNNRNNVTLDNLYLTNRQAAAAVVRKGIEYKNKELNVVNHKLAELDITIKKQEMMT